MDAAAAVVLAAAAVVAAGAAVVAAGAAVVAAGAAVGAAVVSSGALVVDASAFFFASFSTSAWSIGLGCGFGHPYSGKNVESISRSTRAVHSTAREDCIEGRA